MRVSEGGSRNPDDFWQGMKWGFVNADGEVVIPLIYERAEPFREGLAAVARLDDWGFEEWGFINTSGETVIPFNYEQVVSFRDGIARVTINDESVYINASGEEVIPPDGYDEYVESDDEFINFTLNNSFDHVRLINEDFAAALRDNKFGVINTSGEIAVPFIYDGVGGGNIVFAQNGGLVILGVFEDVETNSGTTTLMKWGIVDMNGGILLPIEYERITHVGTDDNGREYFWILEDGLWGIYTAYEAEVGGES
jgi:hypothetical protein